MTSWQRMLIALTIFDEAQISFYLPAGILSGFWPQLDIFILKDKINSKKLPISDDGKDRKNCDTGSA